MEYYGNTVLEWVIAFGVIISSFFVAKLVYWICKNVISKLTKKTKTSLDDLLLDNIDTDDCCAGDSSSSFS